MKQEDLEIIETRVYERVYNSINREVWTFNIIASATLIIVLVSLIVGAL